MKTYFGERDLVDELENSVVVKDDGGKWRDLPLRLDLRNHSPTGFEWGYGGSGPAQLALAILADCVGDEVAMRVYMTFKFERVARLPRVRWTITEQEIREFVERTGRSGTADPGTADR